TSTCSTLSTTSSSGSLHSQCQRLRRRPRPFRTDARAPPASLFPALAIPISLFAHGPKPRLSSHRAPPQRHGPHMTDDATRDHLTRFLLPRAGVRGVHVHLGETWRRIAASDDYA